MEIPAFSPAASFFWMGNRLAYNLQEISHDPASLAHPGFWAVSTTFEGEWICARFGTVVEANFPEIIEPWQSLSSPWSSTFSREEYVTYVGKVRDEIARGTVYQVNACRELFTSFEGDSLAPLMVNILEGNPAPYASYLRLPDIEIASASPELFLEIENEHVASGPIKGTKSLSDARSDFAEKDVAENVMIVDLIRNDLGKICEVGSVSVPQLLVSQVHPGLSHLVSYVHGTLSKGMTWAQMGEALLPPGSVSGAPKSTALASIQRNEKRRRGPYCGALGWVDGKDALLSVAIRIFWTYRDGYLRFGTGAGITWGSDAQQEWEETELKAARLISIANGERIAGYT